MIPIEEFEDIYNLIPGEPEFELWFDEDGPDYMIIKYADCATFQRCGNGPRGSGEFEAMPRMQAGQKTGQSSKTELHY